MMGELKVSYTDEQMKVMEHIALSPQEWIQNAWSNRARQAMDEVIEKTTNKNPKKISLAEKLQIIQNTDIETAVERQAKFEADL